MNEALTRWVMTPEAPLVPLTLDDYLARPPFHQQALCCGQGPALFVSGPRADNGRLRELCEACPVREECYEYAMADRASSGCGVAPRRPRREMRRRVA